MTVTPEELVEQIHEQNLEALERIIGKGKQPSAMLLQMLDAAAMRGFELGTACLASTIDAQMALRKAGSV